MKRKIQDLLITLAILGSLISLFRALNDNKLLAVSYIDEHGRTIEINKEVIVHGDTGR